MRLSVSSRYDERNMTLTYKLTSDQSIPDNIKAAFTQHVINIHSDMFRRNNDWIDSLFKEGDAP